MTIIYCSFALVNIDRLLCVLLQSNYESKINIKTIRRLVAGIWCTAFLPGLLLWMISKSEYHVKGYYYIFWDIIVISVIFLTYCVVMKRLRSSHNGSITTQTQDVRRKKSLRLAVLLTTTFILCNLLPDIIFMFHIDVEMYYFISILWSTGYVLDPILYIFASKGSREIAVSLLTAFFWYDRRSKLGRKHGKLKRRQAVRIRGRGGEQQSAVRMKTFETLSH